MSNPAAVLIDDDPLVQATWQLRAKKAGKELLVFSTYTAFQTASVSADIPIFIDSSLGDEERGELRAQEIKTAGFERVYLVTGYPADSFPGMPWLDGIFGKTPPTWLF